MPRTKRPVRKQEKLAENDDFLKKLEKFSIDQKKKIDARAKMEQRHVELGFKILLGSINSSYLQKTVGQVKTELPLKELTNQLKRHSGRSASRDDGYLTEGSSQGSGDRAAHKQFLAPPSARRSAGQRSRSADASARSALKSATAAARGTQRRRSRSVYRTPAYSKNATVTYPPITPKVTPNNPLTVFRQPRQGEMVVSMTGSPVMVPSYYALHPTEKANCNILLKDGTMLSVQPKQLRQSQEFIPFALMDKDMLHQLKTLKDNIDKMVRLGEKNVDT